MGTRENLIAIIRSWVGQAAFTEQNHNNCTQVTADFGSIGGERCYSWCCAGVWDSHRLNGDVDYPKVASVALLKSIAQQGKNQLEWIPKGGQPALADAATFDWGGHGNWGDMHVSTVYAPLRPDWFGTLGCNEHDTVFDQYRDSKFLMGFVRYHGYSDAPAPAPVHPSTPIPPNVRFQWTDGAGHHVGTQVWHADQGVWWTQLPAGPGVWEVVAIQHALTRHGFSCGPDPSPATDQWVDGIGGANTLRAATRFQSSVGLAPDGYVGPVTRARLFA